MVEHHSKPNLTKRNLPAGLNIVFEDKDILAVDKPAGLLTIGSETNKLRTAYYLLTDYVRKGQAKSRNRVFCVHRLDQWTSGILLFAKSEEIKLRLQAQWPETQKTYIAVVYGHLDQKEGTVTSYLAENQAYTVYSTKDPTKGKLSHTAYKVIKESRIFSMLEIDLLTGRKNQIRVHMSDIGHPIAGDRKYGHPKDHFRRLALHARSITFTHPISGKRMTLEARLPAYFSDLMAKK
jgi:tRNA pseudouridine32 synthase/23S rRNA pseudouridine746 synthase/23S rRNA pseudouridine1911/1915/1917 synthase